MSAPVLCFIDWLGLSLRLQSEPVPVDGYVWQDYTATNVWGKRRVLYTDEGDKVLTLLYAPRSSLISSNAGLVEIENQWLYHGGGVERIMEVLQRSVFYEVTGISRLDLCTDFVPDDHQRDVIEGLAEGRYYVQGKRNGSGFWSTNENPKAHKGEPERRPLLAPEWVGRRIPHCQSWGHKTSDIKWKLYYKTKELLDAGGGRLYHKPYIVDQWRAGGLDERAVWRLEVSLKHLNNLNAWQQRIDLQTVSNFRGSIYSSLYNQRFVIRANQGHVDKTNDDVVPFLSLDNIRGVVSVADSRRLAGHNGRLTLLRHLIASLDDEHVLFDKESRTGVLEHIARVVRRDGLQSYFHAMTGLWFNDYVEDVERRAAGNMVIDVPFESKSALMMPNDRFDDREGESLKWAPSEALRQQREDFTTMLANLKARNACPPDGGKDSNGTQCRIDLQR